MQTEIQITNLEKPQQIGGTTGWKTGLETSCSSLSNILLTDTKQSYTDMNKNCQYSIIHERI